MVTSSVLKEGKAALRVARQAAEEERERSQYASDQGQPPAIVQPLDLRPRKNVGHQRRIDDALPATGPQLTTCQRVCHQANERQFLKWFDWMGVQRHLKAAGIFARLNHRDGKPGYMADVPRTLDYVRDVCSRYGELTALGDITETVINRL